MSTNFVPLFDKMGTQPGNNHQMVGGGRGGTQGGTQWSGSVTHVKLVSNATDEDFQTGRTKAAVLTVERPQSVNILMDSNDRINPLISMNPFFFRVTLNSNLFRSRFMRVRKVVVPIPPNITQNNNVLNIFEGADVLFSVTIPPGYYNTSEIANTIQLLLTAATPVSIFTCVYVPLTKSFRLTSTLPFYISLRCSFVERGANFIPFQFFDPLAGATVAVNGALMFNSGVSSLLYTRYIFVCSEALNTFSFADTKTSNTSMNEDVLAIADFTSAYTPADWDVGRPFAGGFHTILTPEAPHLSLRNPQRNLSSEADVYVLDEYGNDFNEAFNLGAGFPPNAVGLSFWMEITF